MQLARNTLITRTSAGVAIVGTTGGAGGAGAGSSAVDGLAGASVDMAGYEGALFLGHIVQGGTGGAVSFTVRQSTAEISANSSAGQGVLLAGSTSTIAAGSSATAETFVVDVYRPRSPSGARFLHSVLTVASSCSFVGPSFALQYDARVAPASTSAGNSTASQNGITGGVVVALSPST